MPTSGLALRVLTGTSYAARSYDKTPVPTPRELHMMNRMGTGYSRETWAQLRAAGGAGEWFRRQLEPSTVPETELVEKLAGWFPDLLDDPALKMRKHSSGTKGGWEYARDLGNYTLVRRIYSTRPVHETMVDFWANHLHVTANGGQAWVQRWDYDQMLRSRALGRFEDLLVAATLHPAMLVYLDNFRSERDAPNENHGRELLELHTLGRDAGYSEGMVKDSARILSGYSVDFMGTWRGLYSPAQHTTGRVRVLDFTDVNDSPDGSELTVRYLRYLANHPWTARTLARRLAVRFVSDTPSEALTSRLAQVYLDSGTDISATLLALVDDEEFWASAGAKVRTPAEDLVATCRVMGMKASEPRRADSFASRLTGLPQSTLLYQWPRPDGPPETSVDWASAGRMLSSFRVHWSLSSGYYPTRDVEHRPYVSWLPQRRIRLDEYLDHMSRMLLGRPSTSRELRAVCQATGLSPDEIVTKDHPLMRYMFVRLAVVLLDSPTHMSR